MTSISILRAKLAKTRHLLIKQYIARCKAEDRVKELEQQVSDLRRTNDEQEERLVIAQARE